MLNALPELLDRECGDQALLRRVRETAPERKSGFERDDTPPARLGKLEALVIANASAPGDLPLLTELLSIPLDNRYPALDLTPQRKKNKTFEALLRQLAGLARDRC